MRFPVSSSLSEYEVVKERNRRRNSKSDMMVEEKRTSDHANVCFMASQEEKEELAKMH